MFAKPKLFRKLPNVAQTAADTDLRKTGRKSAVCGITRSQQYLKKLQKFAIDTFFL